MFSRLHGKKRWAVFAPLAVVGIALFVALGGILVEQLWNWLGPELFGWREITFWQALGLLVLCRILFGGLGHHGPRRGRRMRRRWEEMSPEERERLRHSVRDCCGFGPSPTETAGQ